MKLFDKSLRFERLRGRALNVSLGGDTLDTTEYDAEYGDGAADVAVSELRPYA